MSKEPVYDILIAGGGASGLMAALLAGKKGQHVCVLEQKDVCGKKLLATGNGKCNFTNEKMDASCFHGDQKLIQSVLSAFDHKQTLSLFHEIGILPRNKNGYYYPASEQAASVVSALTGAILRLQADVFCGEKIIHVKKLPGADGGIFRITTETRSYRARRLLIAAGLKAAPKLGSDGSILPILTQLGHHIIDPVPALCGFYAKGMRFPKVAGVRTEACVSLYIDDVFCCSDHGELQLTEYGISGIPVFQISSPASRALYEKKNCTVMTDFAPSLSEEVLHEEILLRRSIGGEEDSFILLNGILPAKLAEVLLSEAGINSKDPVNRISDQKLAKLARVVKNYRITLTKARDYEFAQVCSGGIPTEEIRVSTLESRLVPGLYFAGEILDVDGICGGYNLQWAWSSAYAAVCAMTDK